MKMQFPTPTVSVIIPTYNRCNLIQVAINSVLAQDYKDYEIIVIDDGSTDGTGQTLTARYGDQITYIWQENHGESSARNKGISLAKGEYIALLDSDDMWLPNKLTSQVHRLQSNPDVGAVFCQVWQIDGMGRNLGGQPLGLNTKSTDLTLENLLVRNKIPGGASTCLIRRSILHQLGGFPEDIQYGEDWELWLQIAAKYKIEFISEPLSFYRRHQHSQRFFPNIEVVKNKLEDHLLLIKRTIAMYPEIISKDLNNQSLSFQYFVASLASYLLNYPKEGKQKFIKAIELYPKNWTDEGYVLSNVLIFANSYALDDNGIFSPKIYLNFINNLCSNLPERLSSPRLIRYLKGNAKLQLGFCDYHMGNRFQAILYLLQGITLVPRLMSLSVLAILAEPLLGKKFVDRLRRIRYQRD